MDTLTKDKYIDAWRNERNAIEDELQDLDQLHEFTPEQQKRYDWLEQRCDDLSQMISEMKTHQ